MANDSSRRRIRSGKGQALAETALVTTILLLLLTAVVDFGAAFYYYLALQNAAGEGAYYGARFPDNEAEIIARTKTEAPAGLLDWDDPDVTATVSYRNWTNGQPVNNPDAGDYIDVRITFPYTFIGPLPHMIGFSQIPITAEATQAVLTD